MHNDLISIVVPVYNGEKTIKECLKCLCGQTYKNIEIICVYLEGEDNTLDAIKSYDDMRIRVVHQPVRNGAGGARNIGVDNACGEWLAFAEADDLVDYDFYETLLNRAKETSASVVQGEMDCYGQRWGAKHDRVYEGVYNKYSLIKNGASFDKLFSRQLICDRNIRFFENYRFEDNPFLFKALYYAPRVATVCGSKYYYRPSAQNSSYKMILKQSVVPIVRDITGFIKSTPHSIFERWIAEYKILESFAGEYIFDSQMYQELKGLFNEELVLKLFIYRRLIKRWKRRIFHRGLL